MEVGSGALEKRKEGGDGALLHSENGELSDVEMTTADDLGEFS
jgi:hypothetical protein